MVECNDMELMKIPVHIFRLALRGVKVLLNVSEPTVPWVVETLQELSGGEVRRDETVSGCPHFLYFFVRTDDPEALYQSLAKHADFDVSRCRRR